MKKTVFTIMLAILCTGAAFSQQYTVAVAGFETMGGVTEDELAVVTEVFTTQLASTGVFRIADRRSLDRIMAEMQFQASDWSDSAKTAAIGKVLSAHYIIRGQLTKYGNIIYWTARMLDVSTAHALYAVTTTMNNIEQVFDRTASLCTSLTNQFKIYPPEVLQGLPNIALAGFDVVGSVTPLEVNLATELLMSYLAASGKVKIGDRAGLDKIAQEMQFQASDWADKNKTAAMGRALNAQFIVRGQIMRMGNNIICTSTMLDVNTAEILHTGRAQVDAIGKVFEGWYTNPSKREGWNGSGLAQIYTQLTKDLPLAPPQNLFVGRWQCIRESYRNGPSMTCILNFQADGKIIVERYDTISCTVNDTGSEFWGTDRRSFRWGSPNRNGTGTGTYSLSREGSNIRIELSLNLSGVISGIPTRRDKLRASINLLEERKTFSLSGLIFAVYETQKNGRKDGGPYENDNFIYSIFTRIE